MDMLQMPQDKLSFRILLGTTVAVVLFMNVAQATILFLSAVPGIAMIVWHFIVRTNYLHVQLGKLYRKSNIGEDSPVSTSAGLSAVAGQLGLEERRPVDSASRGENV